VTTATAPAAEVRVADHLDEALDPSTVMIHSIRFGSTQVDLPPGVLPFTTIVDLRATRGLFVKVSAGLVLGSIVVALTSLDPTTGQPPTDGSVGFLPPNEISPEGEGSISFTVMPKEGLATGTVIKNTAEIVFDTNDPIATATWINTVDASAPR
jgi:hypothetical protein